MILYYTPPPQRHNTNVSHRDKIPIEHYLHSTKIHFDPKGRTIPQKVVVYFFCLQFVLYCKQMQATGKRTTSMQADASNWKAYNQYASGCKQLESVQPVCKQMQATGKHTTSMQADASNWKAYNQYASGCKQLESVQPVCKRMQATEHTQTTQENKSVLSIFPAS